MVGFVAEESEAVCLSEEVKTSQERKVFFLIFRSFFESIF